MVRHLTTSGAGIDVAVGAAGTGKSFTFDAARDAWETSGYSVFGAALSARAAAELSAGSGIPSMTITRLLNQLDEGRLQLDAGCVVVIDSCRPGGYADPGVRAVGCGWGSWWSGSA